MIGALRKKAHMTGVMKAQNNMDCKITPVHHMGGSLEAVDGNTNVIRSATTYGKELLGQNPYLQINAGQLVLRTVYNHTFTEQKIEEGRMCSVSFQTEQIAEILAVEVV